MPQRRGGYVETKAVRTMTMLREEEHSATRETRVAVER
jgi:hypothetical protein